MKILFMPFYRDNPYQIELANALRGYGVETKFVNLSRKRLFPILRTVFQNSRPDIIHLHWTGAFLVTRNRAASILKACLIILEFLILKIIGISIVWTVHNLFDHEKINPEIEKYFNYICCTGIYDKIIVLSSFSVEAAIKAYRLPNHLRDKFIIIPHGHYIKSYNNNISKNQARDKLGLSAENIVFLYFGLIRPYKGILYMVEEFKKVLNSRARLLIAGNPKSDILKHELERCCKGHKLIKIYPKFIKDDEIEIYMNAADIVVLPFNDILNSGSVILAMSFGKAVICPKLGAIPEIIDEKGGFLYDPDDKSGLLKAMNEAIKSDLFSMGQNNYEKVKSFDWERIAEKTYGVYKSCKI